MIYTTPRNNWCSKNKLQHPREQVRQPSVTTSALAWAAAGPGEGSGGRGGSGENPASQQRQQRSAASPGSSSSAGAGGSPHAPPLAPLDSVTHVSKDPHKEELSTLPPSPTEVWMG